MTGSAIVRQTGISKLCIVLPVAAHAKPHIEIDFSPEKVSSGDIAMAQTQNPEIGFAIPQEGTFIFVDNWAIPKGARHKELAEEFINFVLRPEISAMIVNHVRYASVNEAATPLVKPEILNGPSYHVPEGTKLWWLADLGRANELYERVWMELKGR